VIIFGELLQAARQELDVFGDGGLVLLSLEMVFARLLEVEHGVVGSLANLSLNNLLKKLFLQIFILSL